MFAADYVIKSIIISVWILCFWIHLLFHAVEQNNGLPHLSLKCFVLKKCQRYGRWLPNLFRKQNIITALQVNKPVRPLWQRRWTWQVQNRGLLLINVSVYSGLPEEVHILPNCLHSILNRYSFILIQGKFTFKQAQHSHSQHMVILATLAVLHYNTGGLCDALHRTKRISSLFLFLPFSLFLSPLPSSLTPYTHTQTQKPPRSKVY